MQVGTSKTTTVSIADNDFTQVILVANDNRRGVLLQNNNASDDLFVCFNDQPASTATMVTIPSGSNAFIYWGGDTNVPTGVIYGYQNSGGALNIVINEEQ